MVEAIKKLTKPIDEIKYPSNFPYRVMYKDAQLSLLIPYYGAPATIVAFEIAIAYKINKFIIVGEAAAIDPKIKLIDLVFLHGELEKKEQAIIINLMTTYPG
jgi:purine-nucleoside phosphorylase